MRFSVKDIGFFEREVRLRMPFRFGAVTLTQAPQAFARARIRLENGIEAQGAAAAGFHSCRSWWSSAAESSGRS